jgi:peptidoglycan/xylan/chitin deacetylase (PgdA/CDA1 family)
METEEPLVSFTFDDFPRSAVVEGGAILGTYGIRGTFFASFGMVGTVAPTGEIFSVGDLNDLVRQGHELGCHTYDHCDAWDTSPAEFEASIIRNRAALEKHLPGTSFRTSSYPISWPRPQTKRQMPNYFDCCRGGGQTFNARSLDLNNVSGFFLEKSRGDFDSIARLIAANNRRKGWLIFVTHDISDAPTRFGCTPKFFDKVVRQAVQSGAEILTVCDALKKIRDKRC